MGIILYLYENEMPTISMFKQAEKSAGKYRKKQGIIISVKNVDINLINEADVLYFIRPSEVLSYKIARRAKKLNKLIITYCDDDLYNASCDSILDSSRVKYFKKTLAESDIICSSSPRIAEKYRQYTKLNRGAVTHTTVDPNDIVPHTDENEKVKIVYAAGASHTAYFNKYIAPVFYEICRTYGSKISITFVGVHPEFDKEIGAVEVNYAPLMPLDKYRRYMNEQNFDIGLSPIDDDEFSKCKYFNKFIEYSMCGIMGIYTNIEPYTYIVENEKNGLLAEPNPNSWKEAICRAISDAELRKSCVTNAQELLKIRFNQKAVHDHFMSQVPEFEEYTADCAVKFGHAHLMWFKIEYWLIYIMRYLLTGMNFLKKNGLRSLFKKVKAHFTEKANFNGNK